MRKLLGYHSIKVKHWRDGIVQSRKYVNGDLPELRRILKRGLDYDDFFGEEVEFVDEFEWTILLTDQSLSDVRRLCAGFCGAETYISVVDTEEGIFVKAWRC